MGNLAWSLQGVGLLVHALDPPQVLGGGATKQAKPYRYLTSAGAFLQGLQMLCG